MQGAVLGKRGEKSLQIVKEIDNEFRKSKNRDHLNNTKERVSRKTFD